MQRLTLHQLKELERRCGPIQVTTLEPPKEIQALFDRASAERERGEIVDLDELQPKPRRQRHKRDDGYAGLKEGRNIIISVGNEGFHTD